MTVIMFIIQLVKDFVKVDEREMSGIENDAKKWWDGIDYSEGVPEEERGIMYYFKVHAQKWYTKLFLCVMYVFAYRWVANFMNPKSVDDDEIEE